MIDSLLFGLINYLLEMFEWIKIDICCFLLSFKRFDIDKEKYLDCLGL